MSIFVDLRTRILPLGHNVFIARPGKECRLYNDFLAASVIGPELPEISLTEGVPVSATQNLDLMIRRANAIRLWVANKKPSGSEPDMDLSAYQKVKNPVGKNQFIYFLNAFFQGAQKGDLVVIPQSSPYGDAVLAEFVDDSLGKPFVTPISRFSPYRLPVRRIRVLRTVPKREIPTSVIEIFSVPTAIVLAPESSRPRLYNKAYGSYVYKNNYNTQFEVVKDQFSTEDDLYIGAFIKFIAANTKNVTFDGGNTILGIEEAAFTRLGDFAPSLRSNVNSPGFLSLRSDLITPLVVSAMMALAINVGPAAAQAAQDGTIVIGNSSEPNGDPCTAAVGKSVADQMRLMFDSWPKACEIVRAAAKETGLKTDATISK